MDFRVEARGHVPALDKAVTDSAEQRNRKPFFFVFRFGIAKVNGESAEALGFDIYCICAVEHGVSLNSGAARRAEHAAALMVGMITAELNSARSKKFPEFLQRDRLRFNADIIPLCAAKFNARRQDSSALKKK